MENHNDATGTQDVCMLAVPGADTRRKALGLPSASSWGFLCTQQRLRDSKNSFYFSKVYEGNRIQIFQVKKMGFGEINQLSLGQKD